jgi:exodeoxyribonuclease V alpha subunit
VGDRDQLPPIGLGAPFIDLMKLYPQHVMRLSHCMRSERQEILDLAAAVRVGSLPPTLAHHWPPAYELFDYGASPEESLANQTKYRILTPQVVGPYGSRQISAELFRRAKGTLFAPIIIAENNFKLGLYNGLLGTMETREGKFLRAYFSTPSGIESFSPEDLPPFELAYAITVHKAQGSEFGTVYFVLPPGSESFGKELFYTGITRARERLLIAAPPGQIALLLETSKVRCTGVLEEIY